MRLPGWTNSMCRLIVAAYVGALLYGPPPLGFLGFRYGFRLQEWPVSILAVLGLLALPWMVAGAIAGRRLGAYAGLTFFLIQSLGLAQTPHQAWLLVVGLVHTPWLMLIYAVPVVACYFGGWFSSRFKPVDAMTGWRGWRVIAGIVVAVTVHSFTVGPGIAAPPSRASVEPMSRLRCVSQKLPAVVSTSAAISCRMNGIIPIHSESYTSDIRLSSCQRDRST